jgi:hypothetical protein
MAQFGRDFFTQQTQRDAKGREGSQALNTDWKSALTYKWTFGTKCCPFFKTLAALA